jgi:hypothetical protein
VWCGSGFLLIPGRPRLHAQFALFLPTKAYTIEFPCLRRDPPRIVTNRENPLLLLGQSESEQERYPHEPNDSMCGHDLSHTLISLAASHTRTSASNVKAFENGKCRREKWEKSKKMKKVQKNAKNRIPGGIGCCQKGCGTTNSPDPTVQT